MNRIQFKSNSEYQRSSSVDPCFHSFKIIQNTFKLLSKKNFKCLFNFFCLHLCLDDLIEQINNIPGHIFSIVQADKSSWTDNGQEKFIEKLCGPIPFLWLLCDREPLHQTQDLQCAKMNCLPL